MPRNIAIHRLSGQFFFGSAIQEAMFMAKETIDPTLALSIVMEFVESRPSQKGRHLPHSLSNGLP